MLLLCLAPQSWTPAARRRPLPTCAAARPRHVSVVRMQQPQQQQQRQQQQRQRQPAAKAPTVKELRAELAARGLPTSGLKAELIARLAAADEPTPSDATDAIVLAADEAQPLAASADALDAPLIVDEALLAQVKQEIWRTSSADADVEALAREQAETVGTVVEKLELLLKTAARARSEGMPDAQQPMSIARSLTREMLDAVIAPHLPLLMLRGYPAAARAALSRVRSSGQQAALLLLTQYMSGVYEEMSDKLGDLQWQQLQKLRELCDAAAEGGTEQLMETAVLMKAELDTDFCNFINYAIEAEEQRLREAGYEPVGDPTRALEAADKQAQLEAAAGTAATATEEKPLAQAEAEAEAEAAERADAAKAAAARAAAAVADVKKRSVAELPEQRWLMVLRVVRQGVYALLAKDYEDDVKWVRYIIGLASPEARRELAERTLEDMSEAQRESFKTTVTRITDNLSVQRDARDLEILTKVREIEAAIASFDRPYSEHGYNSV